MLECVSCGDLALANDQGEPPRGWASASSCMAGVRRTTFMCSARCALSAGESKLTIAALWPADATDEMEALLRASEDRILRRARTAIPLLAGLIRGGVFKAREERADAKVRARR
jgi:hypothetical protein